MKIVFYRTASALVSHLYPLRICRRACVVTGALVTLLGVVLTAGSVRADFDQGNQAFLAGYFDKARIAWSKSATQGDTRSQFHLGKLFDSGTGVQEDNTQAHFWYALAAGNGHEEAGKALTDVEKEMTEQEIARATDLTSRFFNVFSARLVDLDDVEIANESSDKADDVAKAPTTNSGRGNKEPEPAVSENNIAIVADTDGKDDAENAQEPPMLEDDAAGELTPNESADEPTNEKTTNDTEVSPADSTKPTSAPPPANNDTDSEDSAIAANKSEQSLDDASNVTSATPDPAPPEQTADESTEASSETIAKASDQSLDIDDLQPPAPIESRGVLPAAPRNANDALKAKMRDLIKEVQAMLNQLGYEAGPEDGVIGERTRRAVTEFQEDSGLPDNGEIEPRTIRALRSKT